MLSSIARATGSKAHGGLASWLRRVLRFDEALSIAGID